MKKTDKAEQDNRPFCDVCETRRSRECGKLHCGMREELTAAPKDDVYFIAEGCSVTTRKHGAE